MANVSSDENPIHSWIDPEITSPCSLGQNAGFLVFHHFIDATAVDAVARTWFIDADKSMQFYASFWDTLRALHESGKQRSVSDH